MYFAFPLSGGLRGVALLLKSARNSSSLAEAGSAVSSLAFSSKSTFIQSPHSATVLLIAAPCARMPAMAPISTGVKRAESRASSGVCPSWITAHTAAKTRRLKSVRKFSGVIWLSIFVKNPDCASMWRSAFLPPSLRAGDGCAPGWLRFAEKHPFAARHASLFFPASGGGSGAPVPAGRE